MKFNFYARRIPLADQEHLGNLCVRQARVGKRLFKVKALITSLSYSDYLLILSVKQGKFLLTNLKPEIVK